MSFHLSPMVAFGGGANVGYKYFLTDKFITEGSLDLAFIYVSSWLVGGGGFAPTWSAGIDYPF